MKSWVGIGGGKVRRNVNTLFYTNVCVYDTVRRTELFIINFLWCFTCISLPSVSLLTSCLLSLPGLSVYSSGSESDSDASEGGRGRRREGKEKKKKESKKGKGGKKKRSGAGGASQVTPRLPKPEEIASAFTDTREKEQRKLKGVIGVPRAVLEKQREVKTPSSSKHPNG